MTRRSKRSSPRAPPRPPKDLKAADTRLKGKPSPNIQESNPISEDLESGIIRNWNLPKPNINTCIPPEHWPYNESDPKKWPIDIVHLLHEASAIKLKEKGAVPGSNNEFFRSSISHEIYLRQLRNKSAKGKAPWMTATDLKVVIKKLHSMAEGEVPHGKGQEEREEEDDQKPSVRRGRSKANNTTTAQSKPDEVDGTQSTQPETAKRAPRGRGRPKKPEIDDQTQAKPGMKRQASDLPIRPARKIRGGRSPKAKIAAPPPVTPANPPENSEEEEEGQENEPPEPVSGRHIYGDLIMPTTVDFNTESDAPARARTRQTRKRGRADNDKPPTEVQIDSDPRDIDATGFLSELDPKEMRRRRKPRLSRLQQDPIVEPAWSQDVAAPPQTPLLTPTADAVVSGTPAAPQAGLSSPPPLHPPANTDSGFAIKLLLDLLPGIPDAATAEERSILQDRVSLLQRDVIAYTTAVSEIHQRADE